MTWEFATLIIWAMFFSYLSLGVVLLLCAKVIEKALRQHERRLDPTLQQLARMKRTLDFLEAEERVRRQEVDYSQEDEL